MTARTKNTSQHVLTKHANENTKCISIYVYQIPPMPTRPQNASQHVLAKHISCQRGHQMHLNLSCLNPSHASEDTKCILTCVDQTTPMQAREQNESQRELTNPLPCQRGHKIYLNLCWPNPFFAGKDTNFISTNVEEIHPMPVRTQNTYLIICWPNPSHASEDTKFISTCVE